MTVIRHRIDTYGDITELMSAVNATGYSNQDLILAAIEDTNTLIATCNGNTDRTALEESSVINLLVENLSNNGDVLTDDRLEDIYYIAGLLTYEMLVALFEFDNFYLSQIDINTAKLTASINGDSATVRMEIKQYWTLDDIPFDDVAIIATTLITEFFNTYKCTGKRARELRCALRGIVQSYKV